MDSSYFQIVGMKTYSFLSSIIEIILSLSPDKTDIERGFSVANHNMKTQKHEPLLTLCGTD